jgi:hypothetical protein
MDVFAMKFRTTSLGMKQKKLLVTLLAACFSPLVPHWLLTMGTRPDKDGLPSGFEDLPII